jgi:hypothetical protein
MASFERVTDRPLLGLEAVPWAEPATVQKGGALTEREKEVRRTIMHPTVVEIARHVARPPDRFIMYYAPHHSHGIGAATASSLEGPWRPLAENPILTLDQFGGFVHHISGPEVIFHPEEKRFLMYFHGSVQNRGQQTGVATSTDGVHFAPHAQDPILGYPYLRVFRHAGEYYGVVRMGNAVNLVCSKDGYFWRDTCGGRLLRPEDGSGEYDRTRHCAVRVAGDTLELYYCTYTKADLSEESIKLATLDLTGDPRTWGRPVRRGVVLSPALDWEANNLRDPYLIEVDGGLYMFYVGGNESGIGLAREGPRRRQT